MNCDTTENQKESLLVPAPSTNSQKDVQRCQSKMWAGITPLIWPRHISVCSRNQVYIT